VLPVKHGSYGELFQQLERTYKEKLPTSFCFDMKLFIDRMLFLNNTILAEIPTANAVPDPEVPFFTTVVQNLN